MDYTGKICPYCKTEFQEGDDIVVCSVCEMPHHKECWIENQACTTFGCTGTILGAEEPIPENFKASFCIECGAPIDEDQKFCSACGTPAVSSEPASSDPMQYQAQAQQESYSAFNNPDTFAFLGSNQTFYINKFDDMQNFGNNISWNWCSFLFGPHWFAFRKMYVIAAIYLLITVICAFIPYVGPVISLTLCVFSGVFGNNFYKNYVLKKVQSASAMDAYSKPYYLAQSGGTSTIACGITIGINAIVSIINLVIMLTS